jgi:hypothetical protein
MTAWTIALRRKLVALLRAFFVFEWAHQPRWRRPFQGGVAKRQVHDLEDRLIADIGNCVAAVERFCVTFRNW